jgi:hypothetical protein
VPKEVIIEKIVEVPKEVIIEKIVYVNSDGKDVATEPK